MTEQVYTANRIKGIKPTVFAEMTQLANLHQAINLGQGFPDFNADENLKKAAQTAIMDNFNQYAPGLGFMPLRTAVADFYKRRGEGTIDPEKEILITSGATEAIFATIMALINPGDEVILFEPYYDSYRPAVEMAGGCPVFYRLESPDWALDPDQLERMISPKTRLIMLNTPHNPTGKVFCPVELAAIAKLCIRHNLLIMSDEVYEGIVFPPAVHHSIAFLPGMWERTITISSLGKSFSVTGWKVGWVIADNPLRDAVFKTHQFITFCAATPLQVAAVTALGAAEDQFKQLSENYRAKRDILCQALREVGLDPLIPQGTYFVMCRFDGFSTRNDVEFCRFLTEKIGVTAIPPGAFYDDPKAGHGHLRFAFCKKEKTLQEAITRLRKLPSYK